MALLGLALLAAFFFSVAVIGSMDDNSDRWIASENVESVALVLFVVVVVAFWVLLGIRIERWRNRNGQRPQ